MNSSLAYHQGEKKYTEERKRAMRLLSNIPDEKLFYVIGFLEETSASANSDSFYSPENMVRLKRSIAQMEATGGTVHDDTITIRKTASRHRTLEERLTAFYGKPLDEIPPITQEECDWGEPEGSEVW